MINDDSWHDTMNVMSKTVGQWEGSEVKNESNKLVLLIIV